jgi:hypothetical protein
VVDDAVVAEEDRARLRTLTDADLLVEIDARLRTHEDALIAEHAPAPPSSDELLSAWAADPAVTRAQVERSRRIAAGTWSGDR